uniref:Uncharacterized protein n=1 Tax=Tetranychus urticae TaxID=32264 RepID=T1KQE3_TETUR
MIVREVGNQLMGYGYTGYSS